MNAVTREPDIVPRTPTDHFEAEEWLRLTEALRLREPELKTLAQSHRLELISNSRWPELRLRQHALFSVTEARVSMCTEPVYPQSGSVRAHPGWVVRGVRHPRPWLSLFGGGKGEAHEVTRISDADLRRSGDELVAALELALRSLA